MSGRQGSRAIHSARKAFLVRGEVAPKLVMVDGSTQTLNRRTGGWR
jgi:lipopolysaccharide export system permease protein